MSDNDKITAAGAIELDEDELGHAQGGYFKGVDGLSAETNTQDHRAFVSKWKMASFDGKGNDVVTEEITFVTEKAKR